MTDTRTDADKRYSELLAQLDQFDELVAELDDVVGRRLDEAASRALRSPASVTHDLYERVEQLERMARPVDVEDEIRARRIVIVGEHGDDRIVLEADHDSAHVELFGRKDAGHQMGAMLYVNEQSEGPVAGFDIYANGETAVCLDAVGLPPDGGRGPLYVNTYLTLEAYQIGDRRPDNSVKLQALGHGAAEVTLQSTSDSLDGEHDNRVALHATYGEMKTAEAAVIVCCDGQHSGR